MSKQRDRRMTMKTQCNKIIAYIVRRWIICFSHVTAITINMMDNQSVGTIITNSACKAVSLQNYMALFYALFCSVTTMTYLAFRAVVLPHRNFRLALHAKSIVKTVFSNLCFPIGGFFEALCTSSFLWFSRIFAALSTYPLFNLLQSDSSNTYFLQIKAALTSCFSGPTVFPGSTCTAQTSFNSFGSSNRSNAFLRHIKTVLAGWFLRPEDFSSSTRSAKSCGNTFLIFIHLVTDFLSGSTMSNTVYHKQDYVSRFSIVNNAIAHTP